MTKIFMNQWLELLEKWLALTDVSFEKQAPVGRHFNLPNHHTHKTTTRGLPLHPENTESGKKSQQLRTHNPYEFYQLFSFN